MSFSFRMNLKKTKPLLVHLQLAIRTMKDVTATETHQLLVHAEEVNLLGRNNLNMRTPATNTN